MEHPWRQKMTFEVTIQNMTMISPPEISHNRINGLKYIVSSISFSSDHFLDTPVKGLFGLTSLMIRNWQFYKGIMSWFNPVMGKLGNRSDFIKIRTLRYADPMGQVPLSQSHWDTASRTPLIILVKLSHHLQGNHWDFGIKTYKKLIIQDRNNQQAKRTPTRPCFRRWSQIW